MAKHVGIFVCDGVEIIDFCGPYEVFCRARPDPGNLEQPGFTVSLIAPQLTPITTYGGMRVTPDYDLASHPALDVILVPGGPGVRAQLANPGLLDWLRTQAQIVDYVTSACTGALLLAAAGLLDGRRVTTHWRSLDRLSQDHPSAVVVGDRRVVQDGNVITGAGVTAGIDLALHVTQLLHGPEVAGDVARMIEYRWEAGPAQ